MITATKKTTIELSRGLYDRLQQVKRERGLSLREVISEACEAHYGVSREARRAALRDLKGLSLPVGTPEEMDRESEPRIEDPRS